MDYVFLAGRILFGGFFILSGIRHFQYLPIMTQFTGGKGFPSPKLAVIGSGLLILFGGVCVILGCRPMWGLVAITLFLVPVTLVMHNYWADTDPMTKQMNHVNFLKNMALLGAAWMLVLIPEPWPYSIDF